MYLSHQDKVPLHRRKEKNFLPSFGKVISSHLAYSADHPLVKLDICHRGSLTREVS